MTTAEKARIDWVPYTMSLPDGMTVFVRIPRDYVTYDRTGEMMFTPQGGHFLDRIRALAMETPQSPSPGYIVTVRQALKLTQAEFARKLGYSLVSVKKWEAGDVQPGKKAIASLRNLVRSMSRKGVVISA